MVPSCKHMVFNVSCAVKLTWISSGKVALLELYVGFSCCGKAIIDLCDCLLAGKFCLEVDYC